MIFGIGIDIAKTKRFEKWVRNAAILERFFNPKEIIEIDGGVEAITKNRMSALCQHYAARFAAKEAFAKALKTGLVFDLRDAFVVNEENGNPALFVENSAEKIFRKVCPEFERAKIFVSMSHEKEFVVSQVLIEI